MLKQFVEKAKQLLDPVGPVQERRDVIRLQCGVTVRVVTEDGASHEAVVTNISLKGLRFESSLRPKKGDRVMIGVANARQGPVSCLVMWIRSNSSGASYGAGVKFEDTQENLGKSWLKETLRQLGFEPGKIRERRNFIRFPSPSQVHATFANRTGDVLGDGRLMNIGLGGALAAVGIEIPVGTPIRLQLDPTLDTPPLDAMGVVRSSVRDIKRQVFVTGMQFQMEGEGQVKTYLRAVKKKLARL